MKKVFILIICGFIFSCGNKKVLQLPEISRSNITEITDVSAAYLFYDETQPDSVALNRKNLISTTNWLVNVDKRLTLKQAIPHIKFLQEKKANSSHKNENAKNYFTCNDRSIKNLGFIEFTNVIYQKKRIVNILADQKSQNDIGLVIHVESMEDIKISSFFNTVDLLNSNIHELIENIVYISREQNDSINLILCFDENLPFQDYILIKSFLLQLDKENIKISNNEFISD